MKLNNQFESHVCGEGHQVYLGSLPNGPLGLCPNFDDLWNLHPESHGHAKIIGKWVKLPRWQQAYGMDYEFSGQVSRALAVPPLLAPFLQWSKATFDEELNGLLVNWYDGKLRHYIGPHRDKYGKLMPGSPIVTVSFGEERIFRMRPWRSGMNRNTVDLIVRDRSVIVIPYETNLRFTHEVPHFARWQGRRVSVTLRAFHR